MGIGELLSPFTTIVRKFRWTLSGTNLNEHFVKKVKFDFVNKEIKLQVIEVVAKNDTDIDVHRWIESDWSQETLTFTTYDGCGHPLYAYAFYNLKLINDSSVFDYASSDVSCRSIKLSYTRCTRSFLAISDNKKEKTPDKEKRIIKRFYFKIQEEGCSELYDIKKLNSHIDVKETELNFLNSKTWINDCLPVNFKLIKQHDMSMLKQLICGEKVNLLLHMWGTDDKPIETWTLFNCQLSKMLQEENIYDITIKPKNIKYVSHSK